MNKNGPTRAAELNTSGLKATLPRIKVLSIFQRSERRHLSAEDVFKALLQEGADVGLATVYRVLEQFVQSGLLLRSHFDADRVMFELNEGTHHDHLVCLKCGRVDEFYDAEIEQRQSALATSMGFKLQEHALALYGLCRECRAHP